MRIKRQKRGGIVGIGVWAIVLLAALALAPCGTFAQEAAEEPPPLPLHTIEGVGGLVLTPTAYLVNPPGEGDRCGKPAFGAHAVWVGNRDLQAFTMTWSPCERVELGYAFNRFGIGDLAVPARIRVRADEIYLHHFNVRVNLIQEGGCADWMPAITAGAHYKYNNDIAEINRDLGGALEAIGYNDNDGVDFTLTATKTLDLFPRPVIATAGLRASKASQLGLTGFGDDYLISFEGSVLTLLTDRLAVGAEYRQKREALGEIDDVVNSEDSWWDVHAAYILNPHATVYATVGDAGAVLDHTDETIYGLVFKYEF